jgi:hypothetical protein
MSWGREALQKSSLEEVDLSGSKYTVALPDFLFFDAWNADMMAGATGTISDHAQTLELKTKN